MIKDDFVFEVVSLGGDFLDRKVVAYQGDEPYDITFGLDAGGKFSSSEDIAPGVYAIFYRERTLDAVTGGEVYNLTFAPRALIFPRLHIDRDYFFFMRPYGTSCMWRGVADNPVSVFHLYSMVQLELARLN